MVGAALLIIEQGGSSSMRRARALTANDVTGVAEYGPPGLARYHEQAPHVASTLDLYGTQGGVQGAGPTPPPSINPISSRAFATPISAFRAFSRRQLGMMERHISTLEGALAAGDRPGAKTAWRSAFADYMRLGAVYLDGKAADLDQAIDGAATGSAGDTVSQRFSGLHRLEFGLWTGAALSSLQPWAQRLGRDVAQLRRVLRTAAISPLDYATRAHEILEDAVRDQLSGVDVRWSHEGLLGTAAGVAATTEVIDTLTPLLKDREGVLPVVVREMKAVRSTLASIESAHGGTLPTNDGLTQSQSERLTSSLGQALEALAQVPGALETANPPPVPAIPRTAFRSAQ